MPMNNNQLADAVVYGLHASAYQDDFLLRHQQCHRIWCTPPAAMTAAFSGRNLALAASLVWKATTNNPVDFETLSPLNTEVFKMVRHQVSEMWEEPDRKLAFVPSDIGQRR
eukprot:2667701-Amphidinium_carterae.1